MWIWIDRLFLSWTYPSNIRRSAKKRQQSDVDGNSELVIQIVNKYSSSHRPDKEKSLVSQCGNWTRCDRPFSSLSSILESALPGVNDKFSREWGVFWKQWRRCSFTWRHYGRAQRCDQRRYQQCWRRTSWLHASPCQCVNGSGCGP